MRGGRWLWCAREPGARLLQGDGWGKGCRVLDVAGASFTGIRLLAVRRTAYVVLYEEMLKQLFVLGTRFRELRNNSFSRFKLSLKWILGEKKKLLLCEVTFMPADLSSRGYCSLDFPFSHNPLKHNCM